MQAGSTNARKTTAGGSCSIHNMRSTFFTIVLILSGVTLISCDTTRRAARRIERITVRHPELLRTDTVRIDTLLIFSQPPDTATIDTEILPDDDTAAVIATRHGAFSVQRLDARKIRIIYTPEPDTLHYSREVVTRMATVEKPRELWRDILLYAMLLFILCLFIKSFINMTLK